MMAPTHLAAGAAASLAAWHVSGGNPFLCMALGALAGLLPDIDHPNGSIRRRLPGSNLLLFWLSHRGITHSVPAWSLFAVLSSHLLPMMVAAPIGMGWLSHLILDMLTKRGIPMAAPFYWRYYSLLPIRTGGWIERLVIMPGLFVVIVVMVWRLL